MANLSTDGESAGEFDRGGWDAKNGIEASQGTNDEDRDAEPQMTEVGRNSARPTEAHDDGDELDDEALEHLARLAASTEEPKKPNYIQIAKEAYKALVDAIIRPPRANYKVENLGPALFTFCGREFTRTDVTLTTLRGLKLECSHWEPMPDFRPNPDMPVVVYLHGNASARLEALPLLSHLLLLGVTVFAFDFAGSGLSGGDYVSLGFYEREDLECVVEHLRMTKSVSSIALWGRSMGAVTALMYGCQDTALDAMILDSPFADLAQLCREIVGKLKEQGINIPGILVSLAIRILSSSVYKRAKFAIRDVSPIADVDECNARALFVAAEEDDFIPQHHSEQLSEKYGGDSRVLLVNGDHNSPRPQLMYEEAKVFLRQCLYVPESWALPINPNSSLLYPPWYYPSAYKDADNETVGVVGFNSEEMGMTQKRQQNIQENVVKMFGQQDDGQAVSAATVLSTVASIAKDDDDVVVDETSKHRGTETREGQETWVPA